MPAVLDFSAEVTHTESGEGIALTWEAVGEKASLCPMLGETTVSCRCLFDVPLEGSRVVDPSDIIGAYTGFELVVEADGIRTVRYAPLGIDCPERFSEWFFEESPGLCPEEGAVHSYAAAQRFEHGRMIWVEELDEFFVLFEYRRNGPGPVQDSASPTARSSLKSLQIIQGPLTLEPGASPDNRVGETPPAGYLEPVSGFGLIWRGEVESSEGLREALGWAEEPEYGFDTALQCEASCGSHWNCYLQGPDEEILHLTTLTHIGRFWDVVD